MVRVRRLLSMTAITRVSLHVANVESKMLYRSMFEPDTPILVIPFATIVDFSQ
jgi:hypothetical protein